MNIENKIQIFKNSLEQDKYKYPETDIADYFFLNYDENDFEYNKTYFSFLKDLKSKKEVIIVIDGIIATILKHDHHDSFENIIESYISCGFIFLEDREYMMEEFMELNNSNKNILHYS